MQEFDYKRALAGDKVVTRDGREVENISYNGIWVVGYVEGVEDDWYTDGTYFPHKPHDLDLFMVD